VDGSCGFGGDFVAAENGNFEREGFWCCAKSGRFFENLKLF
jgi:hypothetical protein